MFNWFKSAPAKLKTLGQQGEELAQQAYKQRGYKIIAANFFNKTGLRLGEIDFIALGDKQIIFVEVKTRSLGANKFGGGAEAVNIFKQRKILKAVKLFLSKHVKYQNFQPQIDVCLMDYSSVDNSFKPATIIPNAVEDWN